MAKNKSKPKDFSNLKCPYCGARVTYRSSEGIYKTNKKEPQMLYVCNNYPECDAYVRCHSGTNIPLGELANGTLRRKRREAHLAFDKLYESGRMTRRDAYAWLSDLTGRSMQETHIATMNEYYCDLIVKKANEIMAFRKNNKLK